MADVDNMRAQLLSYLDEEKAKRGFHTVYNQHSDHLAYFDGTTDITTEIEKQLKSGRFLPEAFHRVGSRSNG